MKKSTSIVVLSTCLGLISSLPAYSNQNTPFDAKGHPLPFVNTPKGVQDYANSLDWGRRKKVNFFDVGMYEGCEMRTLRNFLNVSLGGPFVICGGGYVEVSDPVDSRVCELKQRRSLYYIPSNGEMKYKTERCSIK